MDMDEQQFTNEEQFVVFKLGHEEFAVDIMQVQEIIKIPPITRVPNASPFIEGVINLRGNIVSVNNMNHIFNMGQEAEETESSRIIVLKLEKRVFGIRVDAVVEVIRLQKDQIEPPPTVNLSLGREFVLGIGKLENRLLILLDTHKLFDVL